MTDVNNEEPGDSSPYEAESRRRKSCPSVVHNSGQEDEVLPLPNSDVRLDPQYAKFYSSYQGQDKQRCPPPLELEGTIMNELLDPFPHTNSSSAHGGWPAQAPTAPHMQIPHAQEMVPPSPSMSFSLAHRMAMNCLDSPNLSPMSGMTGMSPQLMPSPAPGMAGHIPTRQHGGISLGGIPTADTWGGGGWPAPQPQQQPFAAAPQATTGVDGEVVIGGVPYHMVPHQQWLQMQQQQVPMQMHGQQQQQMPMQMAPQPQPGMMHQGHQGHQHQGHQQRAGKGKGQRNQNNGQNNRKGHGRGNRRGRGGNRGQWHGNQGQDEQQQSFSIPSEGNALPYNSIGDVAGKMLELAKDQLGCRFLQKCLDEGPQIADLIFAEIEPHFAELMVDPFGNYLCQKLLETCEAALRNQIVQLLAPSLAEICFDSHGTRAVQRLIAILAHSNMQQLEQQLVIGALQENLIALVRNLNGNHVVQACLHHLSSDTNKFIFDNVTANCVLVATHRHGCCVMQRCIDYGNPEQREALIAEIVNKTLLLVQDPFGNYVIQYILDLKTDWIQHQVFGLLTGHFVKLSMGKFSSNVVEKCLVLLPQEAISIILKEISHADSIANLLKDSYANYVIQKAVMLEHPSVLELVLSIKPHLKTLKDTAYGKKLTAKLHKKFGPVIADQLQ